jgi:hypothetical protein
MNFHFAHRISSPIWPATQSVSAVSFRGPRSKAQTKPWPEKLLDLNLDVGLTGFEPAQVDLILDAAQEATVAPTGPEDEIPAYAARPLLEWNGLKRPASPGSFSCALPSCANPLMHPAVPG